MNKKEGFYWVKTINGLSKRQEWQIAYHEENKWYMMNHDGPVEGSEFSEIDENIIERFPVPPPFSGIEEYVKEGILLGGNPEKGFQIFTVPTQTFTVRSLSDLTPEKFREAADTWIELEKMMSQQLELFRIEKDQ